MFASVKSEQFRPITGKETHALKSKSQTGNHLPVLKIFNYFTYTHS